VYARADALAVYGRIRDRLLQDLGVELGEVLRRAHHAMLREDDGFIWIFLWRCQPVPGRAPTCIGNVRYCR
jgi:hypothetical protein